MLWVGLQCVIVTFPANTHLPLDKLTMAEEHMNKTRKAKIDYLVMLNIANM